MEGDPKGFDRVRAMPIKSTGEGANATHTVCGPTGKVLGAFVDLTKAETFRDTLPLVDVFSS